MSETLLNLLTILVAAFTLLLILTAMSFIFFTRIPYVPSNTKLLEKFFKHHEPKKGEVFYDLGAGDGRMLFLANKFGLKAIGYEISPLPYLLGKIANVFKQAKIQLHFKNFLKHNLSSANYVYCYLFPKLTQQCFEKVQKECQPGTYFICNTFSLKSKAPELVIEVPKHKNKLYIYQI
jgi:SAM-dependent methyltransferase